MLSTSTGSENSADGPWRTDDDGRNCNSKAAIYEVWVECVFLVRYHAHVAVVLDFRAVLSR